MTSRFLPPAAIACSLSFEQVPVPERAMVPMLSITCCRGHTDAGVGDAHELLVLVDRDLDRRFLAVDGVA